MQDELQRPRPDSQMKYNGSSIEQQIKNELQSPFLIEEPIEERVPEPQDIMYIKSTGVSVKNQLKNEIQNSRTVLNWIW